jgi:hypothetical protein
MPQLFMESILTESFSKYKLIDVRKIDDDSNPHQAKIPGV